jgi:hypothetical protein
MEEVYLGNSVTADIRVFVGGALAMYVIIVDVPAELNLIPEMDDNARGPDVTRHLMRILVDTFEMCVVEGYPMGAPVATKKRVPSDEILGSEGVVVDARISSGVDSFAVEPSFDGFGEDNLEFMGSV